MNRITQFALFALLVGSFGGTALAQSGGLAKQAEAQRLQKLKAQADAAIQAAKQRDQANARPSATATATATPTNTTINRPTPTATATATTTATASATASSRPATSASASVASSAKPPASATPAGSASAAASALPPRDRTDTAAIALDLEALKKSRIERRHTEVVDLQQRWGTALLSDARASAELKQHAQRIAYLQRIRALAVKASDAALVKDVDLLITKEELRNANAMNALRSGALPVTAAAPAAPTAIANPGGSK
jgi:hypothetical protein